MVGAEVGVQRVITSGSKAPVPPAGVPLFITVAGSNIGVQLQYAGTRNGKPYWQAKGDFLDFSVIEYTGTNWQYDGFADTDLWEYAAGSEALPPKTGWPTSTYNTFPAITLSY